MATKPVSIPHPSAKQSLPKRVYPDLGVQARPSKEEFDRINREATIERYKAMIAELNLAVDDLEGKNKHVVLVPVKIEKVDEKPINTNLVPKPGPVKATSTLLNKSQQPTNISNITRKTSSKK